MVSRGVRENRKKPSRPPAFIAREPTILPFAHPSAAGRAPTCLPGSLTLFHPPPRVAIVGIRFFPRVIYRLDSSFSRGPPRVPLPFLSVSFAGHLLPPPPAASHSRRSRCGGWNTRTQRFIVTAPAVVEYFRRNFHSAFFIRPPSLWRTPVPRHRTFPRRYSTNPFEAAAIKHKWNFLHSE